MHWQKRPAKNQLTMRANGNNHRIYEVVCSSTPSLVKTYQVHRGNHGKERRELIARTPTIHLGIMSAEQVERWARNRDLHHGDPDVRQAEQRQRQDATAEDRVHYQISAPASMMTTLQEFMLPALIYAQPSWLNNPTELRNHPIPLASLHQAVAAANAELERQGISLRIKGKSALDIYPPNAPQSRQMLTLLQSNFRWGYGPELLGTITTGQQPWELVRQQHPDILIATSNRLAS